MTLNQHPKCLNKQSRPCNEKGEGKGTIFFLVVSFWSFPPRPLLKTKWQATQHDCLPSLLSDRDKGLEQPKLVYRQGKPRTNQPEKDSFLSIRWVPIHLSFQQSAVVTTFSLTQLGKKKQVRCSLMADYSHRRGWDLADGLEWLTASSKVATVLGSIPASSDTVETEGGRWSSVE